MSVNNLSISNIRIIEAAKLTLSPKINLFIGDNGSGKSSLLEAITFLAIGKSFRTNNFNETISQDKLFARVVGTVGEDKIGIERNKNKKTTIRINRQDISRRAELSKHLIIQTITSQNADLITTPAKNRRNFIDWGLFHVKLESKTKLQQFKKSLLQRNALLKKNVTSNQEIRIWSQQFALAAESLNKARLQYLETVIKNFNLNYSKHLKFQIKFEYFCGWNNNKPLEEILQQHLVYEKTQKTTKYGPHLADIKIIVNNQNAKHVLSSGQIKVLSFLLRVAQLDLLLQQKQTPIVLLIDDIGSELDEINLKIIFNCLIELNAQALITNIEAINIHGCFAKVFHVKHGTITER